MKINKVERRKKAIALHTLAKAIYEWQSHTQFAPPWDKLDPAVKTKFLEAAALPTEERKALGSQYLTFEEMNPQHARPLLAAAKKGGA
jgi:hypothetical protein